jgi:hypothetical protein
MMHEEASSFPHEERRLPLLVWAARAKATV